ncbi:hypothetical protein Glove_140g12 [Diversispora epigaea]|uniref:Protein kinase domain-containing protein n=1 Tax=Diversispora epigaea TaxID=1348612 RepID=A0A397J1D8_9GLOM|nr:hypothetical protein Glove_140g12 [Diversispora epigaea]
MVEYSSRNEFGISNVKKHIKKSRHQKHQCHNCKKSNIQYNICLDCKLIAMSKWTSGNINIDMIIHMTQSDENANEWEIFNWIDFNKLKNINYLAEGGFGSVWKAEWIDMPEEIFKFYKSNQVALKKLKNSQKISPEFLNELIANFQCRGKYVLPIFVITQDSMTKEYAIVSRYMKNGNLGDFLKENKSLPWIERIWLLNSFIKGLFVIHSKGFVHRDLHPGNLMITEIYSNSKYKFIRLGDLGLCRSANETSSSKALGVLPYIAPEVFNKCQHTQASDIYSVGIIMWMISTGKIPFSDRAYNLELILKIIEGFRPKINKGTPQCYADLMKKCWHKDPSERPNVEMIVEISEDWIDELIHDKKAEHSLMFLNAEQKMQDDEEDLPSVETMHPEAHLTSKPLPPLSLNDLNISDNIDWTKPCSTKGCGTIDDKWDILLSVNGLSVSFITETDIPRPIEYSYRYRNKIGISNVRKNNNKLKLRCHNCENLNMQNNTCSNYKLIEMPKWTSGNCNVDQIIRMTQWRWIDYSKLKNIEYLAFASVWKAGDF